MYVCPTSTHSPSSQCSHYYLQTWARTLEAHHTLPKWQSLDENSGSASIALPPVFHLPPGREALGEGLCYLWGFAKSQPHPMSPVPLVPLSVPNTIPLLLFYPDASAFPFPVSLSPSLPWLLHSLCLSACAHTLFTGFPGTRDHLSRCQDVVVPEHLYSPPTLHQGFLGSDWLVPEYESPVPMSLSAQTPGVLSVLESPCGFRLRLNLHLCRHPLLASVPPLWSFSHSLMESMSSVNPLPSNTQLTQLWAV